MVVVLGFPITLENRLRPIYFGFEIGLMMLTTGFRITFGFGFLFPLFNGLQILFTGFFATFDEVLGKIVGFVVFSKLPIVFVCAVLVVGLLVVAVVLLVVMIGSSDVVVVVVVIFELFVVLQS